MNVNGESKGTGILNITASNEGLNSEVHLTINGGNINIQADNDGINTNEDGVSVTTINGGSLHIVAGLGEEGDGVDSNGYLVINDGVVIAIAKPAADSGLDSDMGSYIHGGTVLATGSTMEWAESDSEQVTMNLQFAKSQGADEAIVITDLENNVLFAYDPNHDETTGSHNRAYQGAIISSPNFEVGQSYHVYIGGDVSGTDKNGLYDISTITSFDGAIRQQYFGNMVGMDGQRPNGNGMNSEDAPELPEGMEQGEMPEGIQPPTGTQRPEGMEPGQLPEGMELPEGVEPGQMPEGMELPEGVEPGQMPGNAANNGKAPNANEQAASINFYMTDKVNVFSGITDEFQQS